MREFLRCTAARVLAITLFLLTVGDRALASSYDFSTPIQLAVQHWLADQKTTGFFPYGFDFLQDKESEQDTLSAPNLTRQAGAAAVLADYYAQTKDPRARPAIVRLLTAFESHSLSIGKRRSQALLEATHVLSLPFGRYKLRNALQEFGLLYQKTGPGKILSPDADYSKAFTGATALALMTELRYVQASDDQRFADLRSAWLAGLVALWVPGEGFRQYPTSIDTTPFFDGEAWRALAEYHRAFPHDHRVNDLLPKVDAALMKNYGGEFKLDFFHWGAMAAAARYADTRDPKFLAFVRAQTRAFLDRRKDGADNDNNCAWVEGLADALGALLSAGEGHSELAGRAQAWVAAEMPKVLRLQIQPKQQDMVFSNARIFAPRLQQYAGCFLAGIYVASTQVDFTSHCVSAMLKLQRNAGGGANH
jgi:hypothetical protein